MRTMMLALSLLLCAGAASAQKYPERKEIRQGNKLYEKGDYAGSELSYRRALEAKPGSVEATNNLSGALYKQGRYEEAAQAAALAARDSTAGEHASGAFYNEGNAHFQQRKLEQAIEAYKNALRRNPADQEAKFNLAYAQKLLQKDKNGGGGGENDQNQDQNKDQNKDQNQDQEQNKDQNQDQKGKNDPDKNKDQKGDPDQGKGSEDPNQQKPDQPDGQSPQPGGMSPQQAEQMLDAMQGAEDNTKKKVDAQKVRGVGRSGKNW